jgi:hypothetical protein
MLEAFTRIYPLAVVVAGIAHTVLGGIWFGLLFGKPYAASLKLAADAMKKPSALFIVGPFFYSLVTILTSAWLLNAMGISRMQDAVLLGLFVGVGLLAPMTLNIAINPLFPRPFYYACINAPLFVVGNILACVILTAMS